jgi:hypothetical protein
MLDIKFADLKVGDSVYFKYRLIHIKPNFQGHFDEFEVLPGVFEWVSAEITMSAPTNFPLYTQAAGLEGGPPPDQDGRSRWRWHKGPVKALEVETAMLDGITPSSRLSITSFKSYDELGAAFWAVAESKANITPEIVELANRITKDVSDPRQQASAIYEWVKQEHSLSFRVFGSRWMDPNVEAALQRSYLNLTLEKGEQALSQIKKERSRERDRDRKDLLLKLSKIGLKLGKYDRTRAFATELILDFGDDPGDFGYGEAAHKGNIVLGRIALAENDIAKAKEHLLIAIRAPLRGEFVWLSDIDLDLARELLAKGEKDAVREYLRLCLSLREREEEWGHLYNTEISALKTWQEQIKAGKVPSLDFDKP